VLRLDLFLNTEVPGAQKHVADLLFECTLITDGLALLPCQLSKSDLQAIVSRQCTTS